MSFRAKCWVPMLVALLVIPGPLLGQVSLTALPPRDRVTVNLSDADRVMVQESRTLPFREGINEIKFSWDGVNLDPDSVRLIPAEGGDELTVLGASYPPEDQRLVWHVHSNRARDGQVTIRYRLNGFRKEITYSGYVRPDNSSMALREEVYLFNHSGESFSPGWIGLGHGNWRQLTWEPGQTKRLSVYRVNEVPVDKTYTYDVRELDRDPDNLEKTEEVAVSYHLVNNSGHNLGDRALSGGNIRMFQKTPDGKTVFTGEDTIEETPVGDSITVGIGASRDFTVRQNTTERTRINVRRNDDGDVVLYDVRKTVEVRIENFKETDATLRVKQPMPREWEMEQASHDFRKHSNGLIQFNVPVEAGSDSLLKFTYVERHLGKEFH